MQRPAWTYVASLTTAVSLLEPTLSLHLHWWAQAREVLPGKTQTQQIPKDMGGRRGSRDCSPSSGS